MKSDTIYETLISDARWWAYDIPGNIGWILYLICLLQCFVQRPEFLEIPLVLISLVIGILPAIAMVVGIAELISERIAKLDRILLKKRLYRGFGTQSLNMGAGGAGADQEVVSQGADLVDLQQLDVHALLLIQGLGHLIRNVFCR